VLRALHVAELRDAPVEVVLLALEGKLELQRHRPFVIDFLDGSEFVVYACDGDNPVGVLCVKKKNDGRTWWVDMSYVRPQYRRQGVSGVLRQHLRECARQDGRCKAIEYYVRLDNEAQIQSALKEGITPTSYHYRYEP
jgi:GNAT superfamily N-acetyltransferase